MMDAVEHVQGNESRLEAGITSEESKNAGIRKPADELEVKDGGIGAEEVQTETGKPFEWLISHMTEHRQLCSRAGRVSTMVHRWLTILTM